MNAVNAVNTTATTAAAHIFINFLQQAGHDFSALGCVLSTHARGTRARTVPMQTARVPFILFLHGGFVVVCTRRRSALAKEQHCRIRAGVGCNHAVADTSGGCADSRI